MGKCIAVRISEAVSLVNASLDSETKFNSSCLEKAIKMSGYGKRSKQRFLKASSEDISFIKSRKGTGGNTVPYKCYIIQQSRIPDEILELLRKGML